MELVDGRIAAPNCVVIMHAYAFQVLDKTPLEVPRAGRLDSCVNETLTARPYSGSRILVV